MAIDIFQEGGLSIYGGLHTSSVTYADDILLKLGIDGDIAQLLRSALLGANTALDNVLIGSPVSQAIAANSYMLSNVTASGDLAFYVNKAGASQMVLWFDGSTGDSAILAASGQSVDMYIGGSKTFDLTNNGTKTTIQGLSGDYWQFGTIGTNTTHALNSENDVFIVGQFEVDGLAFFDSQVFHFNNVVMADNTPVIFGTGEENVIRGETADADAHAVIMGLANASGTDVPFLVIGDRTIESLDIGLFDGATQPTIAMIEKDAKYFSSSAVTSDDGGATNEMLATGIGTNAVVGDIIRVISGTNAVAGFYVVDVVDSANEVTLLTNWTTGDVSSGVVVSYHDFTMLSADGICTRVTDGAPSDSSVEIDRDGWIILDVGNNRLYWRSQSAWKSVLPDGGVKSVVIPFVDGTAATSTGFDVDAESETAVAFGAIPAECNEVISIIIRGRAITTDGTNEMLLDIDVNGGADNEAYNVETYSADDIQSDTVPSTNDDVVSWTVTDAGVVGAGGLSAGDTFIVLATGAPTDATDLATDCHFQSVEVKFK
ncbi:hypothetical protein LCGC14_2065640 [marine sediment metagenome]|uniref:Uncharacterized protein n=1 Tax=marine sediment metagenome TaxID=412755 RepID=A0A0F9HGY6_9ZZZZ